MFVFGLHEISTVTSVSLDDVGADVLVVGDFRWSAHVVQQLVVGLRPGADVLLFGASAAHRAVRAGNVIGRLAVGVVHEPTGCGVAIGSLFGTKSGRFVSCVDRGRSIAVLSVPDVRPLETTIKKRVVELLLITVQRIGLSRGRVGRGGDFGIFGMATGGGPISFDESNFTSFHFGWA